MADLISPIIALDPISVEEVGANLDDLLRHVLNLGLNRTISPEVCTGTMQALTAAKVAMIGDPVFADVLLNLHATPGKPPVRPKFSVINGGNHDHF